MAESRSCLRQHRTAFERENNCILAARRQQAAGPTKNQLDSKLVGSDHCKNEGASESTRGEDAPGALQAAADDLRRNAGADQPTPADASSFHEALRRQAVGLFNWARGSGRLLNGADILARAQQGGQEHRLYEDAARQRYVKITHPDQFGLYPESVPVLDRGTQQLVPSFRLRKALPAEYLDRLQAHNDLFGDDHPLHGAFVHEGRLHTVISQPALKGEPASAREIFDTMRDNGFEVVRSGNTPFFYRPDDNTAVFDGHEGNFLKTAVGVLPIDVIPVHPEGELLDAIREARGENPGPPPPGPVPTPRSSQG